MFAFLTALFRPGVERDLVRRMQQRDPEAVGEIYDLYGRAVYSLVLRIVRKPETAQDLTQEIFLRAWTRSHLFDGEKGSLYTWLMTIARRQALDYVRSVAGRVTRVTDGLEALELKSGDNVEEGFRASADAQRVRAAMDLLPAEKRQLLELAYFDGLSQSEMAERLKLPLGTVKTWVRLALRELRASLAQTGVAREGAR